MEARDDESPYDLAVRHERARIIARAVSRLTDRQKRILVLIYVHDLSFADAGAFLDVSKVAVWKAHRRILEQLAADLAAQGLTP